MKYSPAGSGMLAMPFHGRREMSMYLQALFNDIDRRHETIADDSGDSSGGCWSYGMVPRLVASQYLFAHLVGGEVYCMHWPALYAICKASAIANGNDMGYTAKVKGICQAG